MTEIPWEGSMEDYKEQLDLWNDEIDDQSLVILTKSRFDNFPEELKRDLLKELLSKYYDSDEGV